MNAQDGYHSLDIDRSVGIIHHLSYVRSDEDLKRKMESFSHSTEKQVSLNSLRNNDIKPAVETIHLAVCRHDTPFLLLKNTTWDGGRGVCWNFGAFEPK